MVQTKDIVNHVCSLESIVPGKEWTQLLAEHCASFSISQWIGKADKRPTAVEAEVQSLVYKNSSEDDVIIYIYIWAIFLHRVLGLSLFRSV
jgi:hypothetical protein